MFSVHVSSPSSSKNPFAFLSHLEDFKGYFLSIFCIVCSALHSDKRDVGCYLKKKKRPNYFSKKLLMKILQINWIFLLDINFVVSFLLYALYIFKYNIPWMCPKSFGLLPWFGVLFPTCDASDPNYLGCSCTKLLPALLHQPRGWVRFS